MTFISFQHLPEALSALLRIFRHDLSMLNELTPRLILNPPARRLFMGKICIKRKQMCDMKHELTLHHANQQAKRVPSQMFSLIEMWNSQPINLFAKLSHCLRSRLWEVLNVDTS